MLPKGMQERLMKMLAERRDFDATADEQSKLRAGWGVPYDPAVNRDIHRLIKKGYLQQRNSNLCASGQMYSSVLNRSLEITPDGYAALAEYEAAKSAPSAPNGKGVFIIHGKDPNNKRFVVSDALWRMGVKPEMAMLEPSDSRQVSEKVIESIKSAALCVAVLTKDSGNEPSPNASMEVFLAAAEGKLVVIKEDDSVVMPTNLGGLAFIPMTAQWEARLRDEVQAAGLLG